MKDKLTKKRIRIDYLLVIECAGLTDQFLLWLQKTKSRISINRLGRSFCFKHKIPFEDIYQSCLGVGIKSFEEYRKECIRVAKTPWLED